MKHLPSDRRITDLSLDFEKRCAADFDLVSLAQSDSCLSASGGVSSASTSSTELSGVLAGSNLKNFDVKNLLYGVFDHRLGSSGVNFESEAVGPSLTHGLFSDQRANQYISVCDPSKISN